MSSVLESTDQPEHVKAGLRYLAMVTPHVSLKELMACIKRNENHYA